MKVSVRLVSPDGAIAAGAESQQSEVAGGASQTVDQALVVVVDSYTLKVAIRSIAWDPLGGLWINGVSTKLRGGNLHHDNGLPGAAGNASPNRPASFQSPGPLTFREKGLVIVRPQATPGLISVTASSAGLEPATLTLPVE